MRLDVSTEKGRLFFSPFFLDGKGNPSLAGKSSVECGHAIRDLTRRIAGLMEASADLGQVRDACFEFFKAAFPEDIRRIFSDSGKGEVLFWVDREAAAIPFELAYDGARFLLQKFVTGLIVGNEQDGSFARPAARESKRLRDMFLVSDPCGDLPACKDEGRKIEELLEFETGEQLPRLRSCSGASRSDFLENLCKHDVIHFAGHAEYHSSDTQSGLALSDGPVSVRDLDGFRGVASAPELVFVNACNTARGIDDAGINGVAGGLLRMGVGSVIGPVSRVPDPVASDLAIRFYRLFTKGERPAHALHNARRESLEQGHSAVLAYRLYGDPLAHPVMEPESVPAQARPGRLPIGKLIVTAIAVFAVFLAILLYIGEGDGEDVIYIPPPSINQE